MRNRLNFTLLCCFALSYSCTSTQKTTVSNNDTTSVEEVVSIGGKKDKNGCLISAGMTWSKVKNDCVQIFNVGIRLNPIDVKGSDAIVSAFVLPNKDSSIYELFMPTDSVTFLLHKSNENVFKRDKYTFRLPEGELYIDNSLRYKMQ